MLNVRCARIGLNLAWTRLDRTGQRLAWREGTPFAGGGARDNHLTPGLHATDDRRLVRHRQNLQAIETHFVIYYCKIQNGEARPSKYKYQLIDMGGATKRPR